MGLRLWLGWEEGRWRVFVVVGRTRTTARTQAVTTTTIATTSILSAVLPQRQLRAMLSRGLSYGHGHRRRSIHLGHSLLLAHLVQLMLSHRAMVQRVVVVVRVRVVGRCLEGCFEEDIALRGQHSHLGRTQTLRHRGQRGGRVLGREREGVVVHNHTVTRGRAG